jgi:DNA helicase II / ATP-dependent DNA helicase PcrA
LRAVTAPDGPVLVIAAAGTGKTRTLTHRVAWLVLERGVDPRHILLLTFTNRAAREMLERAAHLIGGDVGGLWGGTFHHSANRMLRRHAARLGYGPDYTILDEDDSSRLLKACIAELGLKDKKFPKAQVLGGVFGLAANRAASSRRRCASISREHAVDIEGC